MGDNKEGQLGLGNYELTDDMYLIARSKAVKCFDVGELHSAFVSRNNSKVYTWGSHLCGKLGLGNSGTEYRRAN